MGGASLGPFKGLVVFFLFLHLPRNDVEESGALGDP